tara:strand:- start:415 stop:1161 length:747 start_codon:yes stop_codon:yes gene_type:complete
MPKYLKSKEGSLESAVVEAVSTAKKDEGFASDAQRKAAFANGYKEPKNKKDKKEEMTAEDKEAYEKFFKSALKKFKVDSPADFKSDEEKKKFFDYVDKNYKGENEKSEQVSEKVEYVEYKFKNKNDAMAAKKMLDAVQLMSFDINDDGASQGELAVDAGSKDMTKYHKEVMKKFRPKVMTQEKKEEVKEEVSLAMKAAQYISSMWAEAAAEKDGVKAKTEEEEEPKKNGKTMTGKEMSKVEVSPKDKE